MTDRTEYIMVSGVRTLVTVEIARDRVAELATALDEYALLPDNMGTGKRSVAMGQARAALAGRLAAWNARLYRLSGGAEGAPVGLRANHS